MRPGKPLKRLDAYRIENHRAEDTVLGLSSGSPLLSYRARIGIVSEDFTDILERMKKIISTTEAPAAVGPYSQAVRVGPTIYCAGQIPLDPKSGQIVSKDISEQTRRVLDNVNAVLKAEGLSFQNIVKTTIFLTDLADFQTVNEIYASYFKQAPPARSTVQVAALPRGARIEIEAIAAAENGSLSGEVVADTSG
jgi:2-iminobutanoate/2-iminopropanoate deaminase